MEWLEWPQLVVLEFLLSVKGKERKMKVKVSQVLTHQDLEQLQQVLVLVVTKLTEVKHILQMMNINNTEVFMKIHKLKHNQNQKHNQNYVAGPKGATMLSLKLDYFENISKFLMQATDIVLRMNVLYSLPIFASLTEEQVKEVAESFDFEEFTEGTTIIKKGEKGNKFYFLKRGKVSVLDMVQGELKMVNQIRGHGSFGELALLNDDPRNAFVVAETDVELYSLKREDFRKLVNLANDSTAREKINKVLSGIESLSRLSKMDISVLAGRRFCRG